LLSWNLVRVRFHVKFEINSVKDVVYMHFIIRTQLSNNPELPVELLKLNTSGDNLWCFTSKGHEILRELIKQLTWWAVCFLIWFGDLRFFLFYRQRMSWGERGRERERECFVDCFLCNILYMRVVQLLFEFLVLIEM